MIENCAFASCDEIWRDVVGFEGLYVVSNLGRIGSLQQRRCLETGKQRNYKERIMRLQNMGGYKIVKLSCEGKVSQFLVHRLVALAFIPNPENKATVNHINGDKSDNRVDNLEWATQSENNKHAYRVLGKKPSTHLDKLRKGWQNKIESIRKSISNANSGVSNGSAKLTSTQVMEIREASKNKYHGYCSDLARKYNVSESCIYGVLSGRYYSSVKE